MSERIIGKRFQELLDKKNCSQRKFADLAYLSRSTISLLCNDKYEKPLYGHTLGQIRDTLIKLGYGGKVMEYLYGKIEYDDIDVFTPNSTPARAYKATEMLTPLLSEIRKSELLEDKRHIRIYGNDRNDFIDMNAAEFESFKFYLVQQIKNSCQNYIDICRRHDENSNLEGYVMGKNGEWQSMRL